MPASRQHQTGFTLLELLVALGITASTVALVFAAYGVIARTEQRAQQTVSRVEGIQSTHNWLQRKLEGARLLSRLVPGATVLFFNGNAAGALWVAPLPERGAGGGLHVIRVDVNRKDGGSIDWVAEALPYENASGDLDWSHAIRTTLAQDLRTLQWRYLDGQTGAWVAEWPPTRKYFPSRISIEVADAQGPWPPLVFTLPRAR